ncbi:FCD domain-containing protein [Paraburkholderia sp. ZP32-5]|uniref:FCD domain-containing protein n=1 Tax=Paraburkholderia sp. ZP32-5 TaxID=2883245 RepID=UPI001F366314|nr:FCD domain-containing protein [Paraburkholderia sp. ZP32-5]
MDIKVTPQTVLLQTTMKLREAIMDGHFPPGTRLVESTLCEMTNVSRTTIREALRRLESERLIVNVPNRGPSVAVITPLEADQIYHVRKMLEGEAAALFTREATAEDITRLEHALRDFESAVKQHQPTERIRATSAFYEIILTGCGNKIIQEILASLLARINVLRAKSMANEGRDWHSADEMRGIFEAIRRRDPIAARAAAELHVNAAHESARIAFNSEQKPKEEPPAQEPPPAEPRIPVIDDALWKRIAALLPDARPRRSHNPGRKPITDRQVLCGILYVQMNDLSWNELPTELGFGSGASCWRRLRAWQESGAWKAVVRLLKSTPLAKQIDFGSSS